MQTIIIASDFSPEARNATDYMLPLARLRNYRVVLFSLKNISVHALNARLPVLSYDSMMHIEKQKLIQEAEQLQLKSDVEVIPYFTSGIFLDELQHCIDEYQAILVVMGMAGKSVDQDLLGNTTTAAINKLTIPILAVPLNAKYEGIKKILYACDMDRGILKKPLEQVRLMASQINAEVEVFHVHKQVDRIVHEKLAELEKLKNDFSKLQISYKDVISSEVVASIKQEIQTTKADLLIMVPSRHGFWSSLVHRSKTRMMAYGSHIPLLSIPVG
ncbi:universal stress protein [Mangrovibacterium marinum]|uniref:Nucleotide-binding universal stress UspA family protein n=1 Tax=Mangrovibacterium marinum TaxID=1639118 RepID=A0A2T5C220_9BACT|nr:universal stress protein [Mangrovibacterium marinum]PTN08697.1 nucleotide-binding universal stress UspA family protein [Mangrovibacterium marinum]